MKILNIGSLNFDRVYEVPHFVAPGETLLSEGYAEFLGGKGLNQSVALARAGAQVFHGGAIGPDGDPLVNFLNHSGVDTHLLCQVSTVCGHAVIEKSKGQNRILVCGGSNQCITEAQIDEMLSEFSSGDLLLLQNETSCVDYAIRQGKKRGMEVALNASPVTPALLDYPLDLVDLLLINEIEGKALSGMDTEDFDRLLESLMKKFPQAEIVLTLGDQGVRWCKGPRVLSLPCKKVQPLDTTAAGDTFTGFFLAARAAARSAEDALALATAASALAVTRPGAAPSIPSLAEVLDFMST